MYTVVTQYNVLLYPNMMQTNHKKAGKCDVNINYHIFANWVIYQNIFSDILLRFYLFAIYNNLLWLIWPICHLGSEF